MDSSAQAGQKSCKQSASDWACWPLVITLHRGESKFDIIYHHTGYCVLDTLDMHQEYFTKLDMFLPRNFQKFDIILLIVKINCVVH